MVKTFALAAGIVYLVAGIAGFIPALQTLPPVPAGLAVEERFGHLFGLFPVNWVHNLMHVGVGIWGLAGTRNVGAAIGFARGLAILYAILTVLGLLPFSNMLFGLAPLYGHDIWLHAGSAAVAAYFGWGAPTRDTMAKKRNWLQVRGMIDSGQSHDKVDYPDPAVAPLGTDEEAGDASTPSEDIAESAEKLRPPHKSDSMRKPGKHHGSS